MQSAYALRICIADTDHGSVRMEMYTNSAKYTKEILIVHNLFSMFSKIAYYIDIFENSSENNVHMPFSVCNYI